VAVDIGIDQSAALLGVLLRHRAAAEGFQQVEKGVGLAMPTGMPIRSLSTHEFFRQNRASGCGQGRPNSMVALERPMALIAVNRRAAAWTFSYSSTAGPSMVSERSGSRVSRPKSAHDLGKQPVVGRADETGQQVDGVSVRGPPSLNWATTSRMAAWKPSMWVPA
jgi:hypothetical protein